MDEKQQLLNKIQELEQKVSELNQRQDVFFKVANNLEDGVQIFENNKLVFANKQITKITGYTKKELYLKDEYDLAKKFEIERVKKFMTTLENTTETKKSIEFWIKTKQGTKKYIKNTYIIFNNPNKSKLLYIFTSDNSKQKNIEQAFLKIETESKMIADNSPNLITRYNKDLVYSYANKSFEKSTSIPLSQFIGKNTLELNLEKELLNFIEEMHLEVFRTGKPMSFEFRMPINKKNHIFQAHMIPEVSKNGTVESVLNISNEITQVKKLQKEKENFWQESVKMSEFLQKWSKNNNKLNQHSHNPILKIANWTKSCVSPQKINRKKFFANDLLQDFFNSKVNLIKEHNLEVEFNLPKYKILINTDKDAFTLILELLFENALESTQSGKIEIGYDAYDENKAVFFIKDTGIGIAPEEIENIFKPYYKINKNDNAGLGLSIAQKKVNSLGGDLWCLSYPNIGSTFCFTLPAKIDSESSEKELNKNEKPWKDKNILIVDDTLNNYILLRELLNKYEVNTQNACNGFDAIKMLQQNNKFNLVLMDIQMPEMNGYETTEKIREFNKNIPIIAQTAYTMYNDVIKALDAGCNDFIAKPIKLKKIISILEKYLFP